MEYMEIEMRLLVQVCEGGRKLFWFCLDDCNKLHHYMVADQIILGLRGF